MIGSSKIFQYIDEYKSDDTLDMDKIIKDNYFNIGKFVKLMRYMDSYIDSFNKRLMEVEIINDDDVDLSSIEHNIRNIFYNRAYNALSNVNTLNKTFIKTILKFDIKLINEYLKKSENYFKDIEEYEKCLLIKTYQDLLKDYLE